MDSFQPARGRTFFEVLCALALSASLAGAWTQTGALALLGASAAAALFGLSHAFGMRRPRAVVAEEPQRIDFVTEDRCDLKAEQASIVPFVTSPEPPEPVFAAEPQAIEPPPPPAKAARVAKTPAKGRARKKAVEKIAPVEEPVHVHLDRLFEPEPFARRQHALFGKRHTLR